MALLGIPSIPTDVWTGLPVWLLAAFAVLTHDFANYWNHRLLHTKWFWPVHAIHHSDPDVNGLTTYRVHALEALVMWGSYIIMLTWLGLPGDAIGFGAVLITLHNMYVHVDVDWHHGPFGMLLASPRFHRWHHADVPEPTARISPTSFPFFDRLFGTYYVPGACTVASGGRGRAPERCGQAGAMAILGVAAPRHGRVFRVPCASAGVAPRSARGGRTPAIGRGGNGLKDLRARLTPLINSRRNPSGSWTIRN